MRAGKREKERDLAVCPELELHFLGARSNQCARRRGAFSLSTLYIQSTALCASVYRLYTLFQRACGVFSSFIDYLRPAAALRDYRAFNERRRVSQSRAAVEYSVYLFFICRLFFFFFLNAKVWSR